MGYSGMEPLLVPAEFWERDDVRAALAARAMTELFVLLRRWAGASQSRIAVATGLTQARVSKIMNRQQAVEKFELVERIADGLDMPDDARLRLGLAPRQSIAAPVWPRSEMPAPTGAGDAGKLLIPAVGATSGHLGGSGEDLPILLPDQSVALDPMKRRTLVTWGVAATAVAVAGLGADARVVGRVTLSDVARLERDTSRLFALDYQHGGDTLWHAAHALVMDAHEMLRQGASSESVERRLLVAAGQTQICAGWLALDAGRFDVARYFYNEALPLAHQNNDPELAANALVDLAFLSNRISRPREALRLADAALRAASEAHAHPRLVAIPQLRLAIAHSLNGDGSSSDNAIRLARQGLDHGTEVPDTWYSFVGPAEIDGVEGSCAAALGRPKRAEELLQKAIQAHGVEYLRNRALYRVRLASARLDQGAPDGAAEAAAQALDDLGGPVSSWRVHSELDVVADRLKAFPEVGGVSAFLHRYSLAA